MLQNHAVGRSDRTGELWLLLRGIYTQRHGGQDDIYNVKQLLRCTRAAKVRNMLGKTGQVFDHWGKRQMTDTDTRVAASLQILQISQNFKHCSDYLTD